MICPRAHLHLLHCRAREILTRIVDHTELSHLARSHISIALQIRVSESSALPLACGLYSLAYFRRWLALAIARQLFIVDARYFDVNVDAIKQRPADSILIAHHLRERVSAFFRGVAPIATRAVVHAIAAIV